MQDSLTNTRSSSITSGSRAAHSPLQGESTNTDNADNENEEEEETVEFSDKSQLPPLFSCLHSEETLYDKSHHYVLCATLELSLPSNPGNAGDALFDCLASFMQAASKEDILFILFPYHLSEYQAVANLLAGIVNIKTLPEEMDDWLHYFPQAKHLYTPLLIGLSLPFQKFIIKLSLWCKEKRFGLFAVRKHGRSWMALISINTMDTETLQQLITKHIQDVPVMLRWKMISLGIQGLVKPENQVQGLHLYVDEIDIVMAKLLPMTLIPAR